MFSVPPHAIIRPLGEKQQDLGNPLPTEMRLA
jgi:hypothetical protein